MVKGRKSGPVASKKSNVCMFEGKEKIRRNCCKEELEGELTTDLLLCSRALLFENKKKKKIKKLKEKK